MKPTDSTRAECPWLTHSEGFPDDGREADDPPIWADFGCIASLGTGGCGFEQQLESTLVALTAQAGPGGPNEGFLRPDSLLVIVYITDEDDCSTGNGEMFNPTREDLSPMNVRCALNPTQLYEIARYHEAFTALRSGAVGGGVVVAAITGIPVDGSWNAGDPIEGLRDMQQINPSDPNQLLPSCQTEIGLAFPPVRIAELVTSFGENGVLASICRSDWSAAMTAIARKVQSRLPRSGD
jgi:hypothetical protein